MRAVESVGRERQLTRGALTVEIGPERETCLVRLCGDLDLASVPLLESELHRLLSTELSAVILDLGDLQFIDSAGLQCLLIAARRSQANGDHLRVLPPTGEVERIMALTGITETLPISR